GTERRATHQPRANISGACLQRSARRPFESDKMCLHDRPERWALAEESRETIQCPGTNERLRKREALDEDLLHPRQLGRGPVEERQCPHDLKPDLPFVALDQGPEEDPFVRCHPVDVIVSQLLEEIECSLGHEPVVVTCESDEVDHPPPV